MKNKTISKAIVPFILLTSFYSQADLVTYPAGYPQFTIKDFQSKELDANGIGAKFSPENRDRLLNLIAAKSKAYAESKDKSYKNEIKLLEFAQHLLTMEIQNEKQMQEVYAVAEQVLYSVMSDSYEQSTSMIRKLSQTPLFLFRYLDTRMMSVPYMFEGKITDNYFKSVDNKPNSSAAKKEATNLVKSSNDTRFLNVDDLKNLTYRQISELDISDKNPNWKSRSLKAKTKDAWGEIERFLEQSIGNGYSLSAARHVVFYNEQKTGATSPKIAVKDAFGQKWKLKWGNETPIEPVNNRLYMAAGAKFADLTYMMESGKAGVTLVFLKDGKVKNAEDFIQSMKDSKYMADISAFIQESGEITVANIDQVLSLYPNGRTKINKKDLLGSKYVTFKESLMSLQSKAIVRGGPTNMHSGEILNDRASRGQVVFDMWIWNQDVKEDNNASILMPNASGGQDFVEFHHDLGAGLGRPMLAGEINAMSVGSDFLSHSVGDYGRSLIFHQSLLFKPITWKKATFADARWMAKQILEIPRAEIEKAVNSTTMPDFYKKVLTYKLLSRRLTIANYFHIDVPANEKNIDVPQVNIKLATRADREAAAQKYGVRLASIEKDLLEAGLLKADGRAVDANGNPFVDTMISVSTEKQWLYSKRRDDLKLVRVNAPITNVNISSCEDTVMIGLLQKEKNISGITQVLQSTWDNVTLGSCSYGKKYESASGVEKLLRVLTTLNLY